MAYTRLKWKRINRNTALFLHIIVNSAGEIQLLYTKTICGLRYELTKFKCLNYFSKWTCKNCSFLYCLGFYVQKHLQLDLDTTQYLYIGDETTDLMLENNETTGKYGDYNYLGIHFNKEETDDKEKGLEEINLIKVLNGIFWSTELGRKKSKDLPMYDTLVSVLKFGE